MSDTTTTDGKPTVRLHLGDCLEFLASIPSGSIDAIISDPPYAEIDRPYGRLTEAEWWDLMMGVCRESRRVIKPSGSAVFILQPNSRKVGSMRGWLFEFQAWACREWNMVQDAYWWNCSALPHAVKGQLTPSVKACVWLGPANCFRAPELVVRPTKTPRQSAVGFSHAKGNAHCRKRMYESRERLGGSWPHNCIDMGNRAGGSHGGDVGHPAGTPLALADWWTRYICPPDGVVLDPFMGSGTMGIAALKQGKSFVGIERDPGYFAIARRRIADEQARMPLLELMA